MGVTKIEFPSLIKAIDEAAEYGCPGAQCLSYGAALNGDLGKALQRTAVWATNKAAKIKRGETPNLNPNELVDARYLFYNSRTFIIHYAQQTGQACNITLNNKSGQTLQQS